MRLTRSILAPGAVLATAVITGGWFLQQGVDQDQNVYLQTRLFQEVVDHVASQYVEDVDRGALYQHAIEGMLEQLDDPNTSFIPASDYEDFRIRTQGDYGGVGLEIVDQDGWITVVSPIPGSPGARAGIRAGDRFVTIEGEDAEGLAVDEAVDRLRGEPGSDVNVSVLRVGVDEPIPFTLKRARIQLRAVPFAAELEDDIGYVPLQIFRESASREVQAAIDSLREEGVRRLILDLRGNPGGLLEEGIGVSDLFLGRGAAVVETRGRARGQDEEYAAGDDGAYEDMPVVVLVDGSSASASEIVAGALQDHDRALVVGNTTFGKGSVQSLFQLSGGNVLRLTTARWYTPVGRSIQKDHGEQARRIMGENGTLTLAGQLTSRPDTAGRPTFESMAGRNLLGGGGITPDAVVIPDTLTGEEQRAVRALYRQAGAFNLVMFNFAAGYVQAHPDLRPDFAIDEATLSDFLVALRGDDVEVDEELFRDASRFVRYQLGREIALQAWGDAGEFARVRGQDRQLARAIDFLRGVDSTAGLFRVAGQTFPPADGGEVAAALEPTTGGGGG